ncbi:MAG: phosphoribosylformylglycinamidine synthase subunit PurS [Leptospirales bacterium]|nr:phosphoribosylformylglycinamidine synthase subunit PurS [Leptospirales bacterium]
MYLAKIAIRLKQSIQDPQGLAILKAVHELGFQNAQDVRMGKFIELWIDTSDKNKAEEDARKMCESLLVNSVMESYEIQLEPKA